MDNSSNLSAAALSALANTSNQVEEEVETRKKPTLDKGHFFRELLRDLIGQTWTLLGLVVAYLVLEGSAKALTGNLILVTLAIWVITFPIRYTKRDHSADKHKN